MVLSSGLSLFPSTGLTVSFAKVLPFPKDTLSHLSASASSRIYKLDEFYHSRAYGRDIIPARLAALKSLV